VADEASRVVGHIGIAVVGRVVKQQGRIVAEEQGFLFFIRLNDSFRIGGGCFCGAELFAGDQGYNEHDDCEC
jgi:hypothetical protein